MWRLTERDEIAGFLRLLNVETFRDLCRRAASENDSTAVPRIKEALQLLLRSEELELRGLKKRRLKLN